MGYHSQKKACLLRRPSVPAAERDGENGMAQNPQTKVNWSWWLHTLIFLAITFGISQMPAPAPLTPYGMKVIGIFVGVLYAWVFIDIIWPSFVGLLAIMLLGIMKPVVLLNKSFGDPIVVMMFFIFIFCACISHYGLSRFISLWFISRSFVRGRPYVFSYVFLVSIMILGGLTSGTPAVLVGWSLFYAVCDLCGYKKGESYPTMMIFGIVFAAQFGMSTIPFKSVPLAIVGAYEKLSGVPIDYGSYMLLAFLGGLLILAVFILLGRMVFSPDVGRIRNLDIDRITSDGSLVLTPVQKVMFTLLVALLGCMLAPSFLPKDFIVARLLNSIGSTGICILIIAIMCVIKVDSKPLLPLRQMIDKGVSWQIIFLLSFALPLSGPMSSPESGITAFLMEFLEPVLGQDSQILFALCIGAFGALLTQFVNNTALGIALMPIVFTYCSARNYPPEVSVILVTFCVHLAFLTPAASSTAATLHGNDWCSTKDIWRIAPLTLLGAYLTLAAMMITIGRFVC